jgi:SAM-dependent methyltransferase
MSLHRRPSGWSKPYRVRHFRRREKFRSDYREIARFLLAHLRFDSAYDLGCANGFLLDEFRATGKRVAGIDASPAVRAVLPPELLPTVAVGDFSDASGTWDLACCVEVAEHIAPERSVDLVRKLVELAREWIYFTAAPPGQPGRGHINCRPHDQWLAWFAAEGWRVDEPLVARFRSVIAGRLEAADWLVANSFLLRPR